MHTDPDPNNAFAAVYSDLADRAGRQLPDLIEQQEEPGWDLTELIHEAVKYETIEAGLRASHAPHVSMLLVNRLSRALPVHYVPYSITEEPRGDVVPHAFLCRVVNLMGRAPQPLLLGWLRQELDNW